MDAALRGLSAHCATEFDWLKVLRKEYGTPFAWISGLLLLVWEHVAAAGAPPIGRSSRRSSPSGSSSRRVSDRADLKLSGRLGTT